METVIFEQKTAWVFAGVLAVSFIGSLIWKIILECAYKNKRKPKYITPLNVLTVGTFIAVYFLFLDFGDFRTVTDSLKNTLDSFKWFLGFEEIYSSAVKTKVPDNVADISVFDRVFVICLYFGLPLLTMRAFFSLFKDKFTRLRYYFSICRECHVFSALTEKSICLATDIYNESKSFIKPLIVFCNVNAGNVSDGLLLRAECIDAGFFRKSVLDFKTNKLINFKKDEKNYFYLSDEDYAINERDCVHLTQSENKAIDHLYVFSSLESSVCIVNTAKKTVNYAVHLINEAQVIAYSLLFEHPMYESAHNGVNSVLVIGAGQNGLEIAKNSIWCGAMNSLEFSLRIVDKEDKMKVLNARYGDFIREAEKAGITVDCECMVKNVDSDGLEEVVSENKDATYIVVALGNDELTLNTAIFLRKLYRRKISGYLPKIIPVLKSTNYKKIAGSAKDFELTPFGFNEDIYSCETVNKWKIEKIAKKLNEQYNYKAGNSNGDNFDDLPEIERLSNIAVAVHSKYKVYDAEKSIEKGENGKYMIVDRENRPALTEEEQNILNEKYRENEHNRWVLFMILNGWKTMSFSTVKLRKAQKVKKCHKDYLSETHACITSNENLARLGEIVNGKEEEFKEFDRVMALNTPDWLIKTLNKEI